MNNEMRNGIQKPPSNEDIQKHVELLRSEAKMRLRRLLGIKDGESNGEAERFVDCIFGAAVLETSSVLQTALGALKGKHG